MSTMETNISGEHFPMTLANRTVALAVADTGFLFLIDIAALFGNIILCVAFVKNNHLRSATNILVFALAACDIIMAFLAMPLSEVSLIAGKWILGDHLCHIQGFLVHFLAFLSLQIMALTAINRYFRVIKPRFYRKVFTPFHTTLMIAVTRVLCFVALASVTFGQHNSFVFHPGKVICVTLHENIFSSQVFTTFSSVAFVFLPACVVIWCYTKVFRAIRRHFRQLASRRVSTVSLNNLTPAEIVVTRTVFAIVLAFFICWIPCIVIDIVDVMRDEWFDRQVYLAYTYFAYTSSAINPFIYGVLNRSFRVEYLKLLRCR